jgi:mannose-6-phosphate isomerase-like protein (cupin superfamily)
MPQTAKPMGGYRGAGGCRTGIAAPEKKPTVTAAEIQYRISIGSNHPLALSTAADLMQPSVAGGTARELYRTPSPIPFLKAGGYEANLTQVTFPAGMLSNAPHHRSGAALHFIVSGTGANTVAGRTEAKGPGALVYEPFDLVHQWGNSGSEPLTFITFNINPEGVAAVLPGNP